MDQCGLSEDEAKRIEAAYHELYVESDEYVQDRLEKASQNGYMELAFGLRLRTPIMERTILNNCKTPREAEAESRTAGNAIGQSYGLLNNRAAIDFQERCFKSKYAELIHPVAHIHDAQYFIVKDDIEIVEWVNKELVECVQWQDLPEIQHDKVKLGGELSIFNPDWSNEIGIPNGASRDDIRALCQ